MVDHIALYRTQLPQLQSWKLGSNENLRELDDSIKPLVWLAYLVAGGRIVDGLMQDCFEASLKDRGLH